MSHAFHTVLFDLDGTLIDSKPGVFASAGRTLLDMGYPVPSYEDFTPFMGPPIRECFIRVCGVEEARVDDAVDRFRRYYREDGIRSCVLYDGVEPMLRRLEDSGLRLGVATSKAMEFARGILRRFGIADRFEALGAAPESNHHATKADSVRQCLREMSLAPSPGCVLVGDRVFDAAGARDAGIGSIGVFYGYGTREEIRAAFDTAAESPAELADLLTRSRA